MHNIKGAAFPGASINVSRYSEIQSASAKDLFYPSDLSIFKTHFYSVMVCRRTCKYVFNYAFRKDAGALVFFEYDLYTGTFLNAGSYCSVHAKDVIKLNVCSVKN